MKIYEKLRMIPNTTKIHFVLGDCDKEISAISKEILMVLGLNFQGASTVPGQEL